MRFLFVALLFIAMSCAKKTNPVTPATPNQPVTPSNPNPNPTPLTSRFIPNWQRDTLVGMCIDVNGNGVIDTVTGLQVRDTLITYSKNDTSFIEHGSSKYYLWWNSIGANDTFVNNDKVYVNCTISTTKDTTGEINQYNVGAFPYRYWDKFYNNWAHQKQTLVGHDFHSKFRVSAATYSSIK